MKNTLQQTLTAAMLAVGMTGVASAANVDVYITGSSAYRGADVNAICHLLTSPVGAFEASASGSNALGTGGAIASANQQLITGVPNATGVALGLTSTNTYFFHLCWSGSLGGLTTLVYNLPPTHPNAPDGTVAKHDYLPDTVPTAALTVASGAAGTTTDGGESLGTDLTTIDGNGSRAADAAFSDVFQTSTRFQAVSLTPATVSAKGASKTIATGIVGVVPFVFVANPDLTSFVTSSGATFGSSFALDNMNATAAKALYSPAGVEVAELTGSATDEANTTGPVIAVGRDADSGTRFTTFAETGFNPVGGTNEPNQYTITKSGTTVSIVPVAATTLFPGTPAATSFSSGQSGYSSGGNQRGALAIFGTSGSGSNLQSYVVGTLGESDAVKIVAASGLSAGQQPSYMAYNGVGYTSSPTTTSSSPFNRTLIDQGYYTFWGYEHCYLDPQTTNAAVINAIAAEVRTVDAPIAGEIISNMAVQRTVEGGSISYVGAGNSTE